MQSFVLLWISIDLRSFILDIPLVLNQNFNVLNLQFLGLLSFAFSYLVLLVVFHLYFSHDDIKRYFNSFGSFLLKYCYVFDLAIFLKVVSNIHRNINALSDTFIGVGDILPLERHAGIAVLITIPDLDEVINGHLEKVIFG